MYRLVYDTLGGKVVCIVKHPGNVSFAPFAEDNTDYQAFLEWNASQSTPLDLNSIDAATVAKYEEQKEQAEVDKLVQAEIREQAITELKKKGKLTADGKLKK